MLDNQGPHDLTVDKKPCMEHPVHPLRAMHIVGVRLMHIASCYRYAGRLIPFTCCFLALTSPCIFWTVSAVSFVRRWNVA